MTIEELVNEYLIEIEIRKYSPRTLRSYRNNLNLFVRFLDEKLKVTKIDDLKIPVIKRFTAMLTRAGKKGTYINSILKTVKSFVQYCYDEGYGGFDTPNRFPWATQEKPVVMAFEPRDVKKMLDACQGSDYMAVRDRAILTTFFETGIRNTELCDIKPEDIRDDYILIHGKNHKERVVPITPVLRKALMRYDKVRENYFAYKTIDDEYFLSYHCHKLTTTATEHLMKVRGAGIEGVRVSPHTCRHFFAQQQVKMGTDLYTISRLLGHENVGITQTYLNSLRNEDVIKMTKNSSVLMNME